jgi:SAM-dependent methyltransferase
MGGVRTFGGPGDSARATSVERRHAEEGRLPVPPVFAVALNHGYRSAEGPDRPGMCEMSVRGRARMSTENAIADYWATGDVYALIVEALQKAGKPIDRLTLADLAPVDHYHARGFPATVELADRLTIGPDDHILDIGCGVGGPARYFAARFGCKVSGIDITPPFIDAARKLTALLHLENQVEIAQGDGQRLPYADGVFEGALTQHVTMNVADRPGFFREAYRVLKPGAFFALTEHGMGPNANPHYPAPWSLDGGGSFLATPSETLKLLEAAGFCDIAVENTGAKYIAAYKEGMALAASGAMPALGPHVLAGERAAEKVRNAARNIEEGRTQPVQVICRKPA